MGHRQIVKHSCGRKWVQRGNQTGHCAQCHRTFDSIGAFDAHQRNVGGDVTCLDPAQVVRTDGSPKFIARMSAANDDFGSLYWKLAPTAQQREWLDSRR